MSGIVCEFYDHRIDLAAIIKTAAKYRTQREKRLCGFGRKFRMDAEVGLHRLVDPNGQRKRNNLTVEFSNVPAQGQKVAVGPFIDGFAA